MENQPLNNVIKQLVQCLKRINEPVSIDDLVKFSKINVDDPVGFKSKIKTLLAIAVQNGLVQEHNHHYFASTHVEDILPLLASVGDSASEISIVSSEETFEEAASLMAITSDLSVQAVTSESSVLDENTK